VSESLYRVAEISSLGVGHQERIEDSTARLESLGYVTGDRVRLRSD
jgi:hypothetical protein